MSVVFTTRRRHYDSQRDTLACSAECPSCNTSAHFWMINMIAHGDESIDDTPALYMMPATEARMNLSALSDRLPENVLQYCRATQEVYQSGNLTATRVMVQSTLDAMFVGFLPKGNSRTTLSKLVQDALPSMDLDLPMVKLATSLRPGEHLDTLFHSNTPATREIADAMMSLLEQLATLLYVLPGEFEDLDKHLIELSGQLQHQQDSRDPAD
ncbi:MAG: hypothetical protein HKN42_05890 [Granulosicoccus sp.]|nr:hypothetical protein [Granulosicoccus sp.]